MLQTVWCRSPDNVVVRKTTKSTVSFIYKYISVWCRTLTVWCCAIEQRVGMKAGYYKSSHKALTWQESFLSLPCDTSDDILEMSYIVYLQLILLVFIDIYEFVVARGKGRSSRRRSSGGGGTSSTSELLWSPYLKFIKASRPHTRVCPHNPNDYRHTHTHRFLDWE